MALPRRDTTNRVLSRVARPFARAKAIPKEDIIMFRKALMAVFAVALAAAVLAVAPRARADQWNQAAKLTFDQPVQLPENTILPPGTYWFSVRTDSSTPHNVVEVSNADHSQVMGTFMTEPAVRTHRTDRVVMRFAEPSTTGQPLTLLSWFYPNDTVGHQFIYSPSQEAQLSASVQITVGARNAS